MVGLSVLTVGLLAATGFLVYQNQQLKKQLQKIQVTSSVTPTPTSSIDPTVGWKTHTDTEYGYSLRYPQDWEYFTPEIVEENTLSTVCFGEGGTSCILHILVKERGLWEREKQLLGFAISGYTEEVSFAGVKGLKRIGGVSETIDPDRGPSKEAIILLKKDSKVYKIWALQQVKDQEDYTDLLDQILSTFRFE